jgi:hypothetical protein
MLIVKDFELLGHIVYVEVLVVTYMAIASQRREILATFRLNN